jgi:S1-C subfamily serine protease
MLPLKEKERMKTRRVLVVFTVLLLAALACQVGGQAQNLPNFQSPNSQSPNSQPAVVPTVQPPVSVQAPVNPAAEQDAFTALYKQVSQGVVAVQVVTSQGAALGSGFVYDTDGHIITNYHVVQGANGDQAEVDFMSGFKTYGTVVGTDLDSDLAILKVDAPASELHPLTLGDSGALQVGQTVVAIGNPFGYDGTMTVGVVSALGRTLDSEHTAAGSTQPFTAGDLIQTDAAINPGNSGGPLFNLNGEVIGVNRAIQTTSYTSTGEPVNSGIGFAVSSDIIKRVMPALIKDGTYVYPYLGLSSQNQLTLDEIKLLGLTQDSGAYVTSVVKGGPADQAGIKAGTQTTSVQDLFAGGDLIVAIDGRPVNTFDQLLAYLITNKSPGDTVVMTVLRGTQKQDITVTLGKRPS